MVEFSVLGEDKSGVSKTVILDFWKTECDLLRAIIERVLWYSVLKGKGVHEGLTLFKKRILKMARAAYLPVL